MTQLETNRAQLRSATEAPLPSLPDEALQTQENYRTESAKVIAEFAPLVERRRDFETITFGKLHITMQGGLLTINGSKEGDKSKFPQRWISVGIRNGLHGEVVSESVTPLIGDRSTPLFASTNTGFEEGLLKMKFEELATAREVLKEIRSLPPF